MSAKTVVMSNRKTMHLFDQIQDPYLVSLKEDLIIDEFSDGELAIKLSNSVRGAYVYLISDASDIFELMFTLDALKRSSAYKVNLILPYYAYARQDKRQTTRGSLGAKVIANMISMYSFVEKVICFDLHADQIRGFFDIPVENILGHTIFLPELQKIVTSKMKISSTDAGGTERSRELAKRLNLDMVQISKHRVKANEVDHMLLLGDVNGYDVILVDDIADTFGTLNKATALLKEHGAKDVYIVCTHPVLSGKAKYRIMNECEAKQIFLSDTINNGLGIGKVKTVSCVPVMEQIIKNIISDQSLLTLNL